MLIEIKRTDLLPKCTIGKMTIDGKFQCYTLEDTVREIKGQPVLAWKMANVTAIPSGEYNVTWNMSTRFKQMMPQILNVPGFEGVRIHAGNTDADTEGCILVGRKKLPTSIGESKLAVEALYPLIEKAFNAKTSIRLRIL